MHLMFVHYVIEDRPDRVSAEQHRHRDARVAGLGSADPIVAVLRVAEVVDGGDGHHQDQ